MGNIIDYATRETRTFPECPFNAVDALVLAALCYQKPPAIVPSLDEAYERYGTLRNRVTSMDLHHPVSSLRALGRPPFEAPTLGEVARALSPADFALRTGHAGLGDPHLTRTLYAAVSHNPRFANLPVGAYEERYSSEEQTQFAAETFLLPDGMLAIVFRGTDDSFVGWREDFNMAFQYPVPAQTSARDYVRRAARIWDAPISLLGHSKGGNLAVYAGINAPSDVRARIVRMYSLDGPGFPSRIVHSDEYTAMIDRIEKIVPDSSVVGMLLETPEPCTVVKSDQKGILQHLAFSWQVRDTAFELEPGISPGSQYFNTALNSWLTELSRDQRKRAVDALFTILSSGGADHISQIPSTFPKAIPPLIGSFVGLNDEDRRNMLTAFNLLIRASLTRDTKHFEPRGR